MFKLGGQKVPIVTVFLAASESTLVLLILASATVLQMSRPDIAALADSTLLLRFAVVVLICEGTLYYYDLYDLSAVSRRSVVFVRLLQAIGATCLVLALLYYLYPQLSLGRSVTLVASPCILAVILSWRLMLDASSKVLRRSERVLFIGAGGSGLKLLTEMGSRPEFNFTVIGFIEEKTAQLPQLPSGLKILGSFAELEEIVAAERADRVIVSLAERRGRMPMSSLLRLKFRGTKVEDAHTLYEHITGRIMLEQLSPSWLILSDGFRKPPFLLFCKRAMDVLISATALILTSPIMLLVAAAIVLESGRPILFAQTRTGMGGVPFKMWKFRSMRQDSEKSGPAWTNDTDRRITRVGGFIRRFRIDELPQMINVLMGQMSIVGPRPEQPFFCSLLEERIPIYAQRHSVRPGITGWAQVKYGYGATIEENQTKLEHDLFYIKHLSMTLDLAIILETWKVLLSGRGAK